MEISTQKQSITIQMQPLQQFYQIFQYSTKIQGNQAKTVSCPLFREIIAYIDKIKKALKQSIHIQTALGILIKEQIFKGRHQIDINSIIYNIYEKLTKQISQIKKKQLMIKLIQLSKTKNHNDFTKIRNTIESDTFLNNVQLGLKLDKLYWNMHQQYISNPEIENNFLNQLRSNIKQQKSIIDFILYFHDFMENYQKLQLSKCDSSEELQYQKLFQDIKIKYIQNHLQNNAFQIFIQNYFESLRMKIINPLKHLYHIIDISTTNQYKIIQEKCQCLYFEKSGLPCSHLIRVMRHLKQDYLKYFDKKWYVIQNE